MHERNAHDSTVAQRGDDWFLESFLGQLLYKATAKKTAWYPEEHEDWEVPEKYLRTKGKAADSWKGDEKKKKRNNNDREGPLSRASSETVVERQNSDRTPDVEQAKKSKKERSQSQNEENGEEDKEEDPNLVGWYGPLDPANPMNWSVLKKCFVTAELCLLTFSIYIGSAIYSPGYESLNESFGIGSVVATLGLTLFVVGYGTGPLFLSPLSEIAAIGRMKPYVITLFLFVVLQPITATVQNVAGLMILRFLAGFVGSPVLATGGASLGDMFSPKTRPYAAGIWGLAAIQGPVLGPLLGGFAIQSETWRWAFWILTWLGGGCLIFLLFFFPETSSQNILLRRARRLRKRTGNENLRSQSELEPLQPKQLIKNTLVMPLWLSISEPICLAINLYIGLVYAILCVWIESFQLVFVQIFQFNLGENGLAYLGLFVGGVLAYIGFALYNKFVTIPEFREKGGRIEPERRLPVAIAGAPLLPFAIFAFGATSTVTIPWIVPIIASAFFSAGAFLLFMACLNYLQDAYPEKAASILAGNDFFRSMMGAGFPWGCVLLGCLTLLFVPIPFVLYKYGRTLRMKSKNARQDI